jgi:hypothetical protein
MKVKDIAQFYSANRDSWSGHFEDILNKLGFEVTTNEKGESDNRTDGRYDRILICCKEGIKYKTQIRSNTYFSEEEKLRDIMNSDIEIII